MLPTLLEHPLSPYSQKNKIALREKGIEFRLIMPGAETELDLSVNPRREVPVFWHDGQVIFDSTVIQYFIEENWTTPTLLVADAANRARARMIEEVMDTQYEAVVWGMMEVLTFDRVQGAAADALLSKAHDQLSGLHAWLERELGKQPWFNGVVFGWADIAVVPFILGARFYDAAPPPGSALGDWLDRCLERPSVAQTAAEASAFAATAGNAAAEALRSSNYQREYRDHRLEWMIRSGGIEVVRDGMTAGNIRFSSEIR